MLGFHLRSRIESGDGLSHAGLGHAAETAVTCQDAQCGEQTDSIPQRCSAKMCSALNSCPAPG
eukprot:scaffold604_cov384-Prasinococcus_capsulatus_cf.AAC.42